MQMNRPAIDVVVGIAHFCNHVRSRHAEMHRSQIRLTCAVADDDDLLPVVLAGVGQTPLSWPACDIPRDVRAVRADEVVARIGDGAAQHHRGCMSKEGC